MSDLTSDVEIDVAINAGDWAGADVGADICAHVICAARAALKACDIINGELSIVLADDAFIQTLSRDYRSLDAPTNVLAFENGDDSEQTPEGAPRLLGDVVVAFETTAREATEGGLSFGDHLSHLVVHGVLHLLGYDHIDDDDAQIMAHLEVVVLSEIGVSDPYVRREIDQGDLGLDGKEEDD